MANICENTIVLYSKHPEEIQHLHNIIQTLLKGNAEVPFTSVLEQHALPRCFKERNQYIYKCSSLSKKKGYFYFTLETTTKWEPRMEIISYLLSTYYQTIDFHYLSTESGCDIFINTDTEHTFLSAKYYLDFNVGDDVIVDTFPNITSLKKFLTKQCGIAFAKWEPYTLVERKVQNYLYQIDNESFIRIMPYIPY